MVCLHSSACSSFTSFIRNPTNPVERISSELTMKILGFYFENKPTIEYHLKMLQTKFRKRLWLLRNLKKAKASKEDLVDSYCCYLRSVLDYCTNVYHPMLSKSQTEDLEKLQLSALKIIYGYDIDKDDLLTRSGLVSLEERRDTMFEQFCRKTLENPRLKKEWIEERDFEGPNLRKQKIIVESFANTNRLFKSPLFTLRRKLNDLLVE